MDMLAHCRAMVAFCRQRSVFEGENEAFWMREAKEWEELLSGYSGLQPEPSEVSSLGPIWPAAVCDERIYLNYPLRYRCPLTPPERDDCQRPCQLLLERGGFPQEEPGYGRR
ncbi:hypothetical protein [Bradyrhizobium sp. C9]|uniref:hypothetical protein n=1 Tax=Bradyrhizobium sp. C9 TaxID=142585 RepID=UPI0011779606|nr:hypothetical protein [Bradyrhizobium sp. C9]